MCCPKLCRHIKHVEVLTDYPISGVKLLDKCQQGSESAEKIDVQVLKIEI
jgi:hypothetical protein